MNARRRVAVLAGGLSLEREVSLRSGSRVAEALRDRGHAVTRLDLDDELVPQLAQGEFDAAYLVLHGRAGEDGTIQGLLGLLDIPYTGPYALASALAWDKAVAKGLLRRAGLSTADWVTISTDAVRGMGAARALGQIWDQVGGPLVVKPAQGGAALGVRAVMSTAELAPALVSAFAYHDVALVERLLEGTEVAVAVVAGQALPPVEITPIAGPYDFSARYTSGATRFHCPARLEPDVLERCQDAAETAYRTIGCRHVARADLIVSADGVPQILELDTCPGMTETSLLPIAAAAAGCGFSDLVEQVLGAELRGDEA